MNLVFRYEFNEKDDRKCVENLIRVPLIQNMPETAHLYLKRTGVPLYLIEDVTHAMGEFVLSTLKDGQNQHFDHLIRTNQAEKNDVEDIAKAWEKTYKEETVEYGERCCESDDELFAAVYRELVHSPMQSRMLRLEHMYAQVVRQKVELRDQQISELTNMQSDEISAAVNSLHLGMTEQNINDLVAKQFEDQSLMQGKWSSELDTLKEVQKRDYQNWLMRLLEEESQQQNGFDTRELEKFTPNSISNERLPKFEESFTIHLGSQQKQMHNLRILATDVINYCDLMLSDEIHEPTPQQIQTALDLYSNDLSGLVLISDRHSNGLARDLVQSSEKSADFHFPGADDQLEAVKRCCGGKSLCPGDVFVTKHSNLAKVHVVFHMVCDDSVRSLEMNSRHPALLGLRNVLKMACFNDVTSLALPLLLQHEMSEEMTVTWCTKRAELVFKCVKGFMIEMATWGGSQIKNIQFVLPELFLPQVVFINVFYAQTTDQRNPRLYLYMIGSARDRHRITVKIHNNAMKRSSDRDTPPRNKRSRSSLGRYDDSSDERITPERIRRRSSRGRSPSPRPRYLSPHRDEYRSSREVAPRGSSYPYKVLCVSSLHPKASEELIKDTVYREYKKFGDISIRVGEDLGERVAYVCFRSAQDAHDARHSKPRIILHDKVALVEPVYEVARPSLDVYHRPRSISPDYDRHYYSSRSPDRLRAMERYERAYGPPGGVAHRDYRRDVLPHDYLPRPPLHHPAHLPPGVAHHYGPPHHMVRSGFKPHPPFEKAENKKDKFPNYLHHVSPEDDPLATRTLFAGNLEINITEEELRRIFGRYGSVEDIDIKRPPPGTGNAFAFVRFQTLDMAHRAKVELSGQYIGKFQCKIGYGKATPTTRIWVGGLGPWTSIPQLEREFDRFGAIKKIDYVKGDNCGYILYDSIDAAQAAVKEMRGFPLGGPERRLRVDFADVTPSSGYRPKPAYPHDEVDAYSRGRVVDYDYDAWAEDAYGLSRYRGARSAAWLERSRSAAATGSRSSSYRPAYPDGYREEDWAAARRLPPEAADYEARSRRSASREPGTERLRSRSPRRSVDSDSDNGSRRPGQLAASRTLPEVARKCSTVWQGALILKNSLFPAKFHLTDGDTDIVETLMKDEERKHQLRITQRLRLDQPKLEDVQKRIATANSHAIFLGLAGSTASVASAGAGANGEEGGAVQTRPLRNLVCYLKQKEAAGVISLLNKETEATGVLYLFPPCAFSAELLKRTCPNLSEEGLKEDHLVIIVVRGGTA